jgi:phosphoglycerol transferase MdoB-like AlkP superfamily enzyme
VPPARIPRSVLVYGLLGLIPFLAPPLISLVTPAHGGILGLVALIYAALILSFLGGARWGQEVARPAPRAGVITLAMLPTLAGFALLLATSLDRPAQLLAMAMLLGLQFFWDAGSHGLPGWYPRLRLILTAGAITGMAAMAWVVTQTVPVMPSTTV